MKEQRKILTILLFLVLLCLGAGLLTLFTGQDPLAIDLTQRLKAPSFDHIFGTDELGRDLYSRTIKGFATTVTISFVAFLTAFVVGTLIGALAGHYHGSLADHLFEWVVTIIFSIPFLLIIAAVLSVIGKNLLNAYVVMSAVMWVTSARIVRTGTIKISSALFVTAERAYGKSRFGILLKTTMPISVPPAFIFAFGYFPEIVGLEAGLSFLGLGVQPPNPGLGKMIFDSLTYMNVAWWYAMFPALGLFLVVVASNTIYRYLTKINISGSYTG
jgi:peptide/nickel transport system permease protein